MTQALAKAPAREQSRLAAISGFTDAEIALMEQTVAPGATRLELAFFLVNAARLGLDPILRQIYLIKYSKDAPAEIVTGIDGYRKRAEDSGVYAGSDDPVFEYDKVGQPEGAPSMASVTVWKIVAGQRVPFTASARWTEFYPGAGKAGEQYRKRPHNQLAIRAESHALRKGFPQQTASLDLHVQPPQEWLEAAEADMTRRDDPEATRRNARKYDEIFGPEDQPMAISPAARRPAAPVSVEQRTRVIEGRVVDTVSGEVLEEPDHTSAQELTEPEPSGAGDVPASPAPPEALADKYRRNRELIRRARELGVAGFDPLKLGQTLDVVDAANLELEDRIARAEWERDEVARQKASEGLL